MYGRINSSKLFYPPISMSVHRQALIYILQGPDPAHQYDGQTTLTPSQRLSCHKYRATHDNRTSKLYQAMREFGVKNFHIEILEKINTTEHLSAAERRHILERNAHVFGLNSRLPRERGPPLPLLPPAASPGALVRYTRGSPDGFARDAFPSTVDSK